MAKKKKRSTKSGNRLPVQLGLHLDIPAKTTPTDLRFVDPNVSYRDWKQVLAKSVQVGNWANWAIGACLVKGEQSFGEEYAQAVGEVGLSPDRATACKYVYERIPDLIRVKELSWSHHREIAPLETEEDRAEWLLLALKKDWSVAELKHELEERGLKKHRIPKTENPEEAESSNGSSSGPSTCPSCGEEEATVKIGSSCFAKIVKL